MNAPGPGHYTGHYQEIEERLKDEIKRAGTINKKFVPAIGHENRERFSLFGQIINSGHQSQLGPGTYDIHALDTVASKKGFNVSLQKQNSPWKELSSNMSVGGLG